MRTIFLFSFALLLPLSLLAQGEFVERGQTAIAAGVGHSFTQLVDYNTAALGLSIKGTLDASVSSNFAAAEKHMDLVNVGVSWWFFKQANKVPISLAMSCSGNFAGSGGYRNAYALGCDLTKRFSSKDPKVFFQPGASAYYVVTSVSGYMAVQGSLSLLWTPLKAFRGFLSGGYALQDNRGVAGVSLGLVVITGDGRN